MLGAWTLLALLVTPVFPHFVSPNELSRWALAASLIERHSLEVTETVRILGRRFEDLAEVDGRLYSNKAPGVLLAALPGYLVVRPIAGPPSAENIRIVLTSMRFFGASLPVVLMALAFIAIGRKAGADEQRIAMALWILLFATPLFAYGLLLFSHALVAAALFGAWAMLFVFRPTRGRDVLSGALVGLAVSSEYTAVFPSAVIMVALLLARDWRRVARVVAAGLPFAVLLAVYHDLAFGSPLRTPYFYERLPEYRAVARSGFFGLHLPSPHTLFRLLLDPARGLFVFSPVLALSIPAFAAARRHLSRAAWWTLVLVPATIVLVYSGYPNWHGGWNVGPRYIVAAVPFLVLPFAFRRPGIIESALAGFSVAAVFLTTIVFPFPPNAFPFPWASLALPLIRQGLTAPNVFHLAVPAVAVFLPVLILLGSAFVSFRARQAGFAIAGAILAIAVGSQWTRFANAPVVDLQRRYIAEVYFEQTGAMGPAAPPALVRRRALEMTLPPSSWPF